MYILVVHVHSVQSSFIRLVHMCTSPNSTGMLYKDTKHSILALTEYHDFHHKSLKGRWSVFSILKAHSKVIRMSTCTS